MVFTSVVTLQSTNGYHELAEIPSWKFVIVPLVWMIHGVVPKFVYETVILALIHYLLINLHQP